MESSSESESYHDDESTCSSSSLEEQVSDIKFFVTRESQEQQRGKKLSYAGIRDLSEPDKIEEEDIVAPDGTVLGVKNRVRAGMAHFENPEALEKKSQEEGKVIVYYTSFRGVRSTFEDCRYARTVMHNLRVEVEEKDVYVNKHFYKELQDRLDYRGRKLPLPQVFISGQHIGGKEEVEELNENGELRRLLEHFEHRETTKNCGYCGGHEFIPCRKCGGSKNSTHNTFTSNFKALRCTHCNENGLEPCPECCRDVASGDSTWDEAELEKWKEKQEYERLEDEEMRKREKREKIKQEALEADFKEKIKRKRKDEERQRKREGRNARKLKDESAANKIARDIEMEIERERRWKLERDTQETCGADY